MGTYLGECPVYVIIMIGRWSSDAVLRYIWKQVEQFSQNVSRRMLRFELRRHVKVRLKTENSPKHRGGKKGTMVLEIVMVDALLPIGDLAREESLLR